MRVFVLTILTSILTIPWGTTQAEFAVIFDDPTTDGYEQRIVDNSYGDQSDTVGFIEVSNSDNGLNVYLTAISKPTAGSSTSPVMQLNVEYINYPGDMNITASDTDFTTGFANVFTTTDVLLQYGAVSVDYFGDSGNQAFEYGFPIHSLGPFNSPVYTTEVSDNLFVTSDLLTPEGSLSIALTFTAGSGDIPFARGGVKTELVLVPQDVNLPVPDVKGLDQSAAEAAIDAAGLAVGAITTQTSGTVPMGNVIKSDPEAGELVPPGSSVDLVVSAGNDFEEVPNQVGLAGAWYDPNFDGEGFNFVVGDGIWTLYYYGWRKNSQRLWLSSEVSGDPILFGKSITLDLYIAGTGNFDDPEPQLSIWGQITIIFDSCSAARVYMQGEDGTKTTSIVKLLGIGTLDCDM